MSTDMSKAEEPLISLRYPNGRIHDETLTTVTGLTAGDRFDLYGRHWKAVGLTTLPRGAHERRRMLCVSTDEAVTPEP